MNGIRIAFIAVSLLFAADVAAVRAQDVGGGPSVESPATAVADAPEQVTPAAALQPSEASFELATHMPPVEPYGERWSPSPVLAQEKNKAGVPFMIAGGAAFIAGLIIGDDVGTVIAVAGVGLGVYGIIIYF